LVVPDEFGSIQQAVDTASVGDVVYVRSGLYQENVFINKSIALKGENKETTIISSVDKNYPTVLVRGSNVEVTGFTLKHHVTSPSSSQFQLPALHLLHVSHCHVLGNILCNGGYGVWLYGSNDNIILENTMSKNNYGIMLELSCNNKVVRNFVSNGFMGIWLLSSSGNFLNDNRMVDNKYNFHVSGAYFNDVDLSNKVNNKAVLYLVNCEDVNVNPSSFPDLGFVALINCTNIRVENLTLTNNYCGLIVFNTSCSMIYNNNLIGAATGIYVAYSFDVTVFENDVKDTGWGINLEKSERINVLRNVVDCSRTIGVRVQASNNTQIAHNRVLDSYTSISLSSSSNITLLCNNLTNAVIAISFTTATKNRVIQNQISSVEHSKVDNIVNRQGICFGTNSDNNVLLGNSVQDYQNGICLVDSLNITVAKNNLTRNEVGLVISHSSNNTITENRISDSQTLGVKVQYSDGSVFYNNNFMNNKKQVDDIGWISDTQYNGSINLWDDGTVGNYWSDYNGTDNDLDYVGDTPYPIDAKNKDNYPLIKPVIVEPVMPVELEPIPEFPSWTIMPLFMTVALLTAIIYKTKLTRKQTINHL
jgi:parallel beta-helix repeat protein